MSVFAARDPSRSRRTLGSSGTLMSNPNNMVNRDANMSLRSKIHFEHARLRRASPKTSHLVPETPEYVIATIRNKLRERHAQGPASFLKLFRNIDADDGGTIDFAEFMQFLGYFHMGNNEAVCREVFHSFDPDGSGDICMQEFLEFLIGRPEGEEEERNGGAGAAADGKRAPATMVIGSGLQEVRPPPKDTQSIGLNAEDIIELLREKVENRTPGKGGRVKTSYHFFKQGEDEITRQHFFQVLENFNIVVDDAKVRDEIWRTFDTDGDGTLDFEEFIKHFIADWVC
jgi:Ca2+-binding EF-hand superfamily protein